MESNIQHAQTKKEGTIQQFAEHYRLRTRRDECGVEIITGKLKLPRTSAPDRIEYASHVYDGFDDGSLGVCLFYPTARRWNAARRTLVAAGLTVKQDGDIEGCLTFDPASRQQVRAAMKAARIRPRREAKEPSPAQLAARAAFAAMSRTAQTTAQASM
jgi:hypothetical protein